MAPCRSFGSSAFAFLFVSLLAEIKLSVVEAVACPEPSGVRHEHQCQGTYHTPLTIKKTNHVVVHSLYRLRVSLSAERCSYVGRYLHVLHCRSLPVDGAGLEQRRHHIQTHGGLVTSSRQHWQVNSYLEEFLGYLLNALVLTPPFRALLVGMCCLASGPTHADLDFDH
jgi:hypothetical protein